MFCVWDLPDHNQVANMLGLPNKAVLEGPFDIIGQLLSRNDEMAPNHREWFARFPGPLQELMSTSETYQRGCERRG